MIYIVLLTGAVTMVYPFLLMLAGSTKSAVDTPQSRIIPLFLQDEVALYRKHIEGLFNESLLMARTTYDLPLDSFGNAVPPTEIRHGLVREWLDFTGNGNLPADAYACGYLYTPMSRGALPSLLRALKKELIREFDGDLSAANLAMGTDYVNWNAFYVLPEDYLHRRNVPAVGPFSERRKAFKTKQPRELCYVFSPEGFFKRGFLMAQYTKDIDTYNEAHGTRYGSWREVKLDRRLPAEPGRTQKEREDWTEYVRTLVNLLWIRADESSAPLYRLFLRAKYQSVRGLNRNYGTTYAAFDEVPLVTDPPPGGLPLSDWDAFLQGWRDPDTGQRHVIPAESIQIHSVETRFRDSLREKFGTLDRLNRDLDTSFSDWRDIRPPQREAHYLHFERHAGSLRREFAFRNYISVIDYIVLHGRGILNTVIYCTLAILAALIVNPLAAYALSRYKPPSAYKILLFLMLTMAFPPMVTQIPAFLMLREFGLLNTFLALILPGLANGYSVFLLKGFFDSLPQELYESAALDGAGEFRIFWQITMSLSKPILAVIALRAFTIAYSNFMMALLICQDEKMWTLMPWLYQLQQRSGQGVVFASLIIAAVPTFLIFIFCQNIIMRGIVVPVEK